MSANSGAVVTDNPTETRFEIHIDDTLAGYIDYREDGGEYALPHTRVFTEFEGRGIGGRLVTGALQEISRRGGTVLPYYPFIPKVIRDHPEYLALVPEGQRAAFGL